MTTSEGETSQVRIHDVDAEGNEMTSVFDVKASPSPGLEAFAYALSAIDNGSPVRGEGQPANGHSPSPAPQPELVIESMSPYSNGNGSTGNGNGVTGSKFDLPPVQITYRDLKFSVEITRAKSAGGGKYTRNILEGCSGTFMPGRLTAVMGASGAGKTTLLNIVSGNATAGTLSGSILLNDQVVPTDRMNRVRELSAYIQQDDVLMATMTVREAVTLSAKLRLPKSMSLAEKLQRVERTISILGLQKCSDTIIGNAFNKGISGGEKRRVSMALELIKSPACLFLDEPTSGLDTFTAFSIVSLIRDVAHEQGKTVVCTIHQPSSDIWRQFDDLVLMAHGRIMYHGPAADVVAYFDRLGYPCPENFNPADHLFMRVLYNMEQQLALVTADMQGRSLMQTADEAEEVDAPPPEVEDTAQLREREAASKQAYDEAAAQENERVKQLLQSWQHSDEIKRLNALIVAPLNSPLPDPSAMRAERPGEWYAFALLSRRRWWDLLRDRMKVRMQFSQYLFFSILIGLIYLQLGLNQNNVQDRFGCAFFVCVQAVFMSYLSNLNTFGPEKIVMMREMESGLYGLPAYFFSRWIIEVPFRILFPIIYAVVFYWMVGFQREADRFFLFCSVLVLIDNCGTNMSIAICSMFPDVQQAMQAGPAFVMPFMIFSGFYIAIESIGWWFRWFSYISPIRWGFVAILKNEMQGLTFDCPAPPQPCPYPTGAAFLTSAGMDSEPTIAVNILITFAILGGFLLWAFSFMWVSTRKR